MAYWCEGAKSKPHHIHEYGCFVNSDPGLIRFFLVFLDQAGVEPAQLRLSVQIHESPDVAAAEKFWLGVTGTNPAQLRRTVLKKHNPRTVRKNTGADYYGCLRIDVLQSAGLYRRIEGWVRAAAAVTLEPSVPSWRQVSNQG